MLPKVLALIGDIICYISLKYEIMLTGASACITGATLLPPTVFELLPPSVHLSVFEFAEFASSKYI